jgi:hypothetical protein
MANTIVHQFDCINKYGWPSKSSATKRSSSEFGREDVPAAVNGSCSTSSADLFKTANKNGSGNMTLAEYMHYVNYTQGAPMEPEHIALHVEHFMRYVLTSECLATRCTVWLISF